MDTERRLFKALGGWRCHSQKKNSTKTQKPPQKKTRKRQKKAKNETFPKSEKAKKNEKNSFAFLCPPAPIHPSPAQDAGGGEYAKNRSSLSFSRKKIGCHTQIPSRTPSRRVVLEQKKKHVSAHPMKYPQEKWPGKKTPGKKFVLATVWQKRVDMWEKVISGTLGFVRLYHQSTQSVKNTRFRTF